MPFGSTKKVFKASSDRQGEQIVTFKYYSEITQEGQSRKLILQIFWKQFLASHLLHWFIFLVCLQTVLQQTSIFTVLFS